MRQELCVPKVWEAMQLGGVLRLWTLGPMPSEPYLFNSIVWMNERYQVLLKLAIAFKAEGGPGHTSTAKSP